MTRGETKLLYFCKFNSLYSPQPIHGQNHEYETLPRRIEKSCEKQMKFKDDRI